MFIQFLRDQVQNCASTVVQQQGIASNVLGQIRSYIPKVQSGWIGGDADEFASDVNRKLVPAMVELIAAIGGINLNLTKATEIIDQADTQVKGIANGLGDMFAQI